MFESIRDQFFPSEIVPGIDVRAETDPAAFWPVAYPMMDAILIAPYAELGAYERPPERDATTAPLAETFKQGHHEYFLFETPDHEAVGYGYGNQRDQETYYMNSSGVLQSYRRRGIYSGFLKRLLSYLAALGYERVISNHNTNNRAILIAKLKAGFNVTAVNLDERWGAQVELTYLFHDDRRRGYERAFSLADYETPISHQS